MAKYEAQDQQKWAEFQGRALRQWQGARMREAADATVALSHEEDCGCSVCERVRGRHEEERDG